MGFFLFEKVAGWMVWRLLALLRPVRFLELAIITKLQPVRFLELAIIIKLRPVRFRELAIITKLRPVPDVELHARQNFSRLPA